MKSGDPFGLSSWNPFSGQALGRSAIQLDPVRTMEAIRNQAETVEYAKRLRAEGDHAENLHFLQDAITRFPDDPEVRIQYATALLPFRPDEAPWQAATAIDLDPGNPWRLVRAASLLYHMRELEAARAYVARAADLAPEDFEFGPELANLGGKLAALVGHDAVAEEALRAALDAEPHRSDFGGDLASFLLERDRSIEARAILEQALRVTPADERLRRLHDQLESED